MLYAQVTLARVVETGEVVALKRIFVRDAARNGIPDNIVREIKCMQELEHPNIVQLRDVFAKVRVRQHHCPTLSCVHHAAVATGLQCA